MSIEATGHAIDIMQSRTDLNVHERFVLLLLSDHDYPYEDSIYAGIGRLTMLSGLADHEVYTACGSLQAKGLIKPIIWSQGAR
jgi:hypothetical protein